MKKNASLIILFVGFSFTAIALENVHSNGNIQAAASNEKVISKSVYVSEGVGVVNVTIDLDTGDKPSSFSHPFSGASVSLLTNGRIIMAIPADAIKAQGGSSYNAYCECLAVNGTQLIKYKIYMYFGY